ncbi:MAG: DUF4124 domain-containing protein [Xanthomonadales bacterium]|nr:DUF4124 domain-containing protein [Xanthomonadales bacterium]
MDCSTKQWWNALTCCVAIVAVTDVANGEMCKWVDENGTIHYAEKCPEAVDSVKVEIQPPPSQAQMAEAERRSTESRRILSDRKSPATNDGRVRSLTLEELGPLPKNTTSTYLITKATGVNFDKDDKGQFNLSLKARNSLPPGAYLETHFPIPGSEAQKQIVEKKSVHKGDEFLLLSEKNSAFKCWNYLVEVFVYADDSKKELLDVHQQTIQCRFDHDLFKGDIIDFAKGMSSGGICPSGDKRNMKKMSVKQLEALCESEREKRIKPEREKLVTQCMRRGDKQDEWCENYYADWGDAQRIDTAHVRPALYYDLPECVAAKEARTKAR